MPGILGVPVPKPESVPVAKNSACRVDDEVKVYLSNVANLAPKTHKAYKRSLELLQESYKKIYVHQIRKRDLQKFDTDLMEQGKQDRTRHNRVQHVVTFLRNKEGRRPGPPITNVSITVKYVESEAEAYTRRELEDLFRACDEDERCLWRFLLGSGYRESECAVAETTGLNRDLKAAPTENRLRAAQAVGAGVQDARRTS